MDLTIDVKFLDDLCQCKRCTKAFARVVGINAAMENLNDDECRLNKNLEGELNDEAS